MAKLAATDGSIRREQVCFHAQQAAEKAIKGVLLSRGLLFPLTHDIEELFEIAEDGGLSVPEVVRNSGLLNPYAVEARYPGSSVEITSTDIEEALEAAEQTLAWARSQT